MLDFFIFLIIIYIVEENNILQKLMNWLLYQIKKHIFARDMLFAYLNLKYIAIAKIVKSISHELATMIYFGQKIKSGIIYIK
jgi:hypothetical protein